MSNAPATPAADNLTVGKYRLLSCLASGQHSQVWEATDNETTRRVAVKMLLPEALKDGEQLSALKHEFKVGSSFEHPNIVKYYEISATKKQAYFAMELFAAPNLKAWVFNDLHGVHMRFKRLIELVAMALEHIHEKGLIHRDIKPENILMNKSAEVRVIDFSLATRAATTISKMFARKQATVQGTRTYMAPEQILGKPLTAQTDIYNLGVTIYELLTGQPPFTGTTPKDLLLRHLSESAPSPSEFNTNVTPEMDRVVARMLSKKPENRQKKVSEFLVEMRNVAVFKEEVTDKVELTEQQQAEEALKKVLGGALDSRADALRTKLAGGKLPPAPPKKEKPKIKLATSKPAPAPPAAPQPAPGMMYPMQPMMPGMPMPMPMQPMPQYLPQAPLPAAYAMPQMPFMPQMPGAPPVAMPAPPGANPWVAVPGAAPGPAAGAPWGGAPAQPVAPLPAVAAPMSPRPAPPPVAPSAVPQVAAQPAPPPVAKPAPPARKPAAPPPKPDEGAFKINDLLGFDELPPVG